MLFPIEVTLPPFPNVTDIIFETFTTTEVSDEVCCECQEVIGGPNGCDTECNNEICPFDPYCCDQRWDELCVDQAGARCNNVERPLCCGCTVGQGGLAGCLSDFECELVICPNDLFCCGAENGIGFWDLICVNTALDICQGAFIDDDNNGGFGFSERRRVLEEALDGYSRV